MASTIPGALTDLTLALGKFVLFRQGVPKITYATGLTMGGGFSYILEKKKYEDLGLVFFFPVGYAGYHLMNNRYILRKELLSYKYYQQNDIDKNID
jgi:hypothetical protein